MVGREGALEILGQALSCLAQAGADAGEVVLLSERDGLTRFANSQIHQSSDVEDVRLQLKAVVDAKEGWATANGVNGEAMARAARAACDIARVQPEGDSGVEPAEPQAYEDAETFDEPTAAAGPEARADAVARAVVRADRHRSSRRVRYAPGLWRCLTPTATRHGTRGGRARRSRPWC